jgi:hypothetical protein
LGATITFNLFWQYGDKRHIFLDIFERQHQSII